MILADQAVKIHVETAEFWVWYEEGKGYAGSSGTPPETVAFYSDFMHPAVAKFSSPRIARDWVAPYVAPYMRYKTSAAKLMRVHTHHSVEEA